MSFDISAYYPLTNEPLRILNQICHILIDSNMKLAPEIRYGYAEKPRWWGMRHLQISTSSLVFWDTPSSTSASSPRLCFLPSHGLQSPRPAYRQGQQTVEAYRIVIYCRMPGITVHMQERDLAEFVDARLDGGLEHGHPLPCAIFHASLS